MTLTEYILSEFAHDKNLEGMVDTADGCATIQMEFYRLEKWREELHDVNQRLCFQRFHWRKTILLWEKNCEPGGIKTYTPMKAGRWPTGKQFSKKTPKHSGGQLTYHEPAVCLCNQGSQESGLH